MAIRLRLVTPTSPPADPSRVLCLVTAAILWAAPAFAQTGTITGTVRDTVTHAPIVTAVVACAEDGTNCDRAATTDASGTYTARVSPGTYYVYTVGISAGAAYADEILGNILCPGDCSFELARQSGTPIVVTANAMARADFDLDPGGAIGGSVTDASTSAPLAEVHVIVYSVLDGEPRRFGSNRTSVSGRYLIEGLPPGRYYAHTQNLPAANYVNEIYDNIPCDWYCEGADVVRGAAIDVTAGVTAADRDFALDYGGRITGTVTDAVTALPVADVCVYAWANPAGEVIQVGQACVDATGTYDIGGLPSGSYILMAEAFGANYVQELYDSIPCPAGSCSLSSATPVAVTLGATTVGRDFTLDAGGTVRGTVRDAVTSQASISGAVVVYSRQGGQVAMTGYAWVDFDSGAYVVEGLPAGTYYAYTYLSGYQNEIFDDIPCQAQLCTPQEQASLGTPIVVAAGGNTTGIDFAVRNDLAPGEPYGLTASVDASTVSLSWVEPYLGGTATSYILEAGLSPGTTIVRVPLFDPRYVATGVGPGRYFVRVRAANAYGIGPPSEELMVTVASGGATPPAAPVNVMGWMSGSRLTLTWGAPSPATSITGYVVEAGSATGLTNIASIGVNARSLTFIPVPAGYYFVRVRAMNASGLGPPSREVLVNSGLVPAPPGFPRALFETVTGSTVTLEWEAPLGGTIAGYVLRAGSAPGLSNLAQANAGPTQTEMSFGGVPPGVYYVRVHALNALGLGPPSAEVIVIVR